MTTNLNFVDQAVIEGTRKTADGYLIADVRCARTGCQVYLGDDIGLPGKGPVNVFRPDDAVFNRDSLSTYAYKPITVGHPSEPVNASNWRKYAVGDIGGEVARDGEFVKVSVKIMDAAAIKMIEDGTREISMGYTTPVMVQGGTAPDGTHYDAVQTGPIRINHLALVDQARGGPELRVGDDSKWGACPRPQALSAEQPKEGRHMADAHTQTVTVGDGTVRTDEAGVIRITQLQKDHKAAEAKVEDLQKQLDDTKKELETKDGELKAAQKALEDASSPAALADAAKKRSKATEAGKKAGLKEEEMEEMNDAAIRRAVVSKQLGDAVAKDMSDDAIEGAFAYAVKALGDAKPPQSNQTSEPLATGIRTNDSDPWASFDNRKKA